MASSSLAKPPSHHRQTSQSTSTSSSSVVTVQRAASMSSRNGMHPTTSGLRSHSPNDENTPPNHPARIVIPDALGQSGTVYRPDSVHGVNEGVGNLNRWSQSTASSKSSVTHRRRSSFSNRLSGSLSSFGGFGSPPAVSPSKKTKPPPPRKENAPGPLGRSSRSNPPKLPPLITLSALSGAVDAANTPSTAATTTPTTAELLSTSGSTSGDADYFGERWEGVAAKAPRGMLPQSVALSSLTGTSSSSRLRDNSPISQSTRPNNWADPAVSMYSSRNSSRTDESERHQPSRRRHSRNRDEPSKYSTATEGESSASSVRSARPKAPKRKTHPQKIILSKALQKANHAVLLDNAQNFEGAMDAYADACNLLQQVMMTSETDEDRQKLEAVSNTYSHRISELQNTEVSYHSVTGKALPLPPNERDSHGLDALSPVTDDFSEDLSRSSTATVRPNNHQPLQAGFQDASSIPKLHPPPRQQSLPHSPYRAESRNIHASEMAQPLPPPVFKVEDKILEASEMAHKQQQRHSLPKPDIYITDTLNQAALNLHSLRNPHGTLPPLSPRRPSSPVSAEGSSSPPKAPPLTHSSFSSTYLVELPASPRTSTISRESDPPNQFHHVRQDTAESTSWLDTIDESGGSSSESVHSRTSSVGLRRKRIRATSGLTEAEFDAALDAAVEAAYDEGFEPDDEDDDRPRSVETRFGERGHMSDARRNVEIAKEMVREAEIEAALLLTRDREKRRLQDSRAKRDSIDLEYQDDESDEEERMLEEMTRDYIMDDSEYDLQSKSALPRQSDSSGFSGRTWGSSICSNPATAGTSLSTVPKGFQLPILSPPLQPKPLPPPSHPPPSGALPPPPASIIAMNSTHEINGRISGPPAVAAKAPPGVRERRLSGTHVTHLKIETNASPVIADEAAYRSGLPQFTPSPAIPTPLPVERPRPALTTMDSQQTLISTSSDPAHQNLPYTEFPSSPEATSVESAASADASIVTVTSGLTKVTSTDGENFVPNSPGRFNTRTSGLKKNFSSSSLKNKAYNGVSHDSLDTSPASSSATQRKGPPAAIPGLSAANAVNDRLATDGIYLFESDIHSPLTPGLPNPGVNNPPLPLEPCPELPLLRPFWFLRCIYQTIAHPRGGYISTRLFIPSSIWRVKNVKLKNVDDKVSACDLLSAALSKLAKVDTFDADAVLEEMQFLENVMEQAQSNLAKKLGNEVGVLGTSSLFKGSNVLDDGASHTDTLASRSSNTHSKSYLSSWRKLRSNKNSGPGVIPNSGATNIRDGFKDGLTLESVPMTSVPDPRFPRRDLGRIHYGGPNANYMAALARLCDAVQVLDQIARQVEDPGLKRSSQTQVGLELSMRHAAEFFGFYVCRFVIGDVSMMLDKFIKRGSEWVLS